MIQDLKQIDILTPRAKLGAIEVGKIVLCLVKYKPVESNVMVDYIGAIIARCTEKDKKGNVCFQTSKQKFKVNNGKLSYFGFVQEAYTIDMYSVNEQEESDFILSCL